jgi:two-component system OmpR family response regulator
MKILIVEDDTRAAHYLNKGLSESGHQCDCAADGETGLHMAITGQYDVLIVDRMMPKLDGLALIAAFRAAGKTTPVMVLSALGEVDDRISGLRVGGDDYLVKPYAFGELLARLNALTRRAQPMASGSDNDTLTVADLVLDRNKHRVTRAEQRILLQPREFRLLEYLMRHADQVVTRTMLLEQVWDYHFDPQTNVIEVHISRLRRKIDRDFSLPLLHTVRGAGYRLGIVPED